MIRRSRIVRDSKQGCALRTVKTHFTEPSGCNMHVHLSLLYSAVGQLSHFSRPITIPVMLPQRRIFLH